MAARYWLAMMPEENLKFTLARQIFAYPSKTGKAAKSRIEPGDRIVVYVIKKGCEEYCASFAAVLEVAGPWRPSRGPTWPDEAREGKVKYDPVVDVKVAAGPERRRGAGVRFGEDVVGRLQAGPTLVEQARRIVEYFNEHKFRMSDGTVGALGTALEIGADRGFLVGLVMDGRWRPAKGAEASVYLQLPPQREAGPISCGRNDEVGQLRSREVGANGGGAELPLPRRLSAGAGPPHLLLSTTFSRASLRAPWSTLLSISFTISSNSSTSFGRLARTAREGSPRLPLTCSSLPASTSS